jgi:hypothetical protein
MELTKVGPGHFYAGVGSRETPEDVRRLMTKIARSLAEAGWLLRSGGQPKGADSAFEEGAYTLSGPFKLTSTTKEIWLPWLGAFGHTSQLTPTKEHYEAAAHYHPNWNACDKYARDLHARNAPVVLGADLRTPVKFVVCWTKDGLGGGGTGQAIRIARANKIPVYDLAIPGTGKLLKAFVSSS